MFWYSFVVFSNVYTNVMHKIKWTIASIDLYWIEWKWRIKRAHLDTLQSPEALICDHRKNKRWSFVNNQLMDWIVHWMCCIRATANNNIYIYIFFKRTINIWNACIRNLFLIFTLFRFVLCIVFSFVFFALVCFALRIFA